MMAEGALRSVAEAQGITAQLTRNLRRHGIGDFEAFFLGAHRRYGGNGFQH